MGGDAAGGDAAGAEAGAGAAAGGNVAVDAGAAGAAADAADVGTCSEYHFTLLHARTVAEHLTPADFSMSFLPGVDGRAATEFTFIPVSLDP